MVELEHLIGSNDDGLVLPIEPVRGRLGLIRGQLRRFLDDHGIDDDAWLLVANELVANAIDAAIASGAGPGSGSPPPGGPAGPAILLSLGADRHRVALTVANVGPAFDLPDPSSMPPAVAARGRGLPLVRALVDGIDVRRVEGVNVVSCWRARPPGPNSTGRSDDRARPGGLYPRASVAHRWQEDRMALTISIEHDNGTTVASLTGDLDGDTCAELGAALAAGASAGGLVIDLAGLTFIDSSGITELVEAREACVGRNAPFTLRATTPSVRRVLEITGLLEHFGID